MAWWNGMLSWWKERDGVKWHEGTGMIIGTERNKERNSEWLECYKVSSSLSSWSISLSWCSWNNVYLIFSSIRMNYILAIRLCYYKIQKRIYAKEPQVFTMVPIKHSCKIKLIYPRFREDKLRLTLRNCFSHLDLLIFVGRVKIEEPIFTLNGN